EGLNYPEIALAIDTTVGAVETLLFRARQRFAESHLKLGESTEGRCRLASQTMAAFLDDQATIVERKGLEAHLDGCVSCRRELARQRKSAAGYAALPFAALPLQVLPAASGGAGIALGAHSVLRGGFAAVLAKVNVLTVA